MLTVLITGPDGETVASLLADAVISPTGQSNGWKGKSRCLYRNGDYEVVLRRRTRR